MKIFTFLLKTNNSVCHPKAVLAKDSVHAFEEIIRNDPNPFKIRGITIMGEFELINPSETIKPEGDTAVYNLVTNITTVSNVVQTEKPVVLGEGIKVETGKRIKSDDPCPCGSGKLFGYCCEVQGHLIKRASKKAHPDGKIATQEMYPEDPPEDEDKVPEVHMRTGTVMTELSKGVAKKAAPKAKPAAAKAAVKRFQLVRVDKKVKSTDPCPCGSGKKYKNCHGKDGKEPLV